VTAADEPRRGPASVAAVLGVGAAVLVAVFGLIGWALGTHTTPSEARLMRHVDQGSGAVVTTIARGLSTFGSDRVLVPIVAVVAVVLAIRSRLALALVVAVSALGGIALGDLVKLLVARPRPPVAHRLVTVASSSFPSGHATQSAAILPALALAAIAFGVPRILAGILAALGVIGVGLSRVLLGVHYPSDVLAGWLLGTAWVVLTAAVITTGWPRRGTPSAPADAPST
jgi:membrane-associated phospholipid phosphatase